MKIDLGANLIVTLEGCDAYSIEHDGVMRCYWTAKMAICCDGSGGNPDNDPCFQAELAYYNGGAFLNPYEVPYIVVPPQIRFGVPGVVMGCQGLIVNLQNGRATEAIVGDQGPDDKIGKQAAKLPNVSGSIVRLTAAARIRTAFLYIIWPDRAAVVDGVEYDLQPS